MPRLWRPGPPKHRHEFRGLLRGNSVELNDAQIVVEHSFVDPGAITATVLGDLDTWRSLTELGSELGGAMHLEACGRAATPELWTDNARFIRASYSSGRNVGKGIPQEVGLLELDDLNEHIGHTGLDEHPLRLVFSLAGPQQVWRVEEVPQLLDRGEVRALTLNERIDLADDLPFDVQANFWTFHEETDGGRGDLLVRRRLRLELTPRSPALHLTHSDMIKAARELVDDLTLLASFVAQRRTVWFAYAEDSGAQHSIYTRSVGAHDLREFRPHELLVAEPHLRSFLQDALKGLRRLRAQGVDLTVPLEYFVAGAQPASVDQQFAVSFLALEKLKAVHPARATSPALLFAGQIDDLVVHVTEWLRDGQWSPDQADVVVRRLRDLRNAPFQQVIETILGQHAVEWRDLYPEASQMTVFKTRNSLFHASGSPDLSHLRRELLRLRSVTARIILRMLGWSDLTRTPDPGLASWLRRP